MNKVAILGASYLQLPLVMKAKEMKLEVHCFAWDNDLSVCKEFADYFYDISVLEKELILEKCKKIGIDGILTIATDICVPTIAYVAEKLNLIGNSVETATRTTNKGKMRDCFQINNIPSPLYMVINNSEELKNKKINFPLIVKPVDRSGSLGVSKVFNESELIDAVHNATNVSFDKNCIIEEFIGGTEVSVETISWKGNHTIITITDKVVTKEPFFVELEHHQPSSFDEKIQEKIKILTHQILEATGVKNGASHVELIVTVDGNVYAIEIGSRMGGDFIGSDLVFLSTGFDYLKAVLEISLNNFDGEINISNEKFSGIYFLSKNTEHLLPYFLDEKSVEFQIVKKELQNVELKKLESSNDRSGYLVYQADHKISFL